MVSESLIWTPPSRPSAWNGRSATRRCPIPRRWPKWRPAPAAIAEGTAGEQVWLLEHPPIYTAGTSAKDADLLDARFPVYRTGRGGQFTYHGPGQRVGYVMLDLKRRKPDVRAYVRDLEQWLIETLALFGVKGERREGRVGIWVQRGAARRQDRRAGRAHQALGDVSWRGAECGSRPQRISPASCPAACARMASPAWPIWALSATMADVDVALKKSFEKIFG